MPLSSHKAAEVQQSAEITSLVFEDDLTAGLQKIISNAANICDLLKSMSNEGRLVILCLLCIKERSVTELEESLDSSQPVVSQQLARLRASKLVKTRRDGQTIYYSLLNEEVRAILLTLTRYVG